MSKTAASKKPAAKNPAAKKSAAKKAATAPPTPAPEKTSTPPALPSAGDKVKYVFRDSEMIALERSADNRTMNATVAYVNGTEAVICAELRPGQKWHRGAQYSADKLPGTWHWPERK